MFKKQMLLKSLPNASVSKLDQLIDFIRDILNKDNEAEIAKDTAAYVKRSDAVTNMTSDLISTLTTALGDFTDEVEKTTKGFTRSTSSAVVNGDRRQMNEVTFNGKVSVDPRYADNVKIIHGTPPPDFVAAFATQLPPTRVTTPFTPFFTLPPGHATMQADLPTFIQQYPWAWYKSHHIMTTTTSHSHFTTAAVK